jgi:hypothetical protein
MPTPQQNAQLRNAEVGFRVASASPKTVPQNATQTVFTVSGGRILVAHLSGVVTTVIAGTTPSAKFVATPTIGAANDMCTASSIAAAAVGTMVLLPPGTGTALTAQTAAVGSLTGFAYGGQIVSAGTIGFNVSAADATGAYTFTLLYVPLDAASSVVAN